jgi:hypothetical protein
VIEMILKEGKVEKTKSHPKFGTIGTLTMGRLFADGELGTTNDAKYGSM